MWNKMQNINIVVNFQGKVFESFVDENFFISEVTLR